MVPSHAPVEPIGRKSSTESQLISTYFNSKARVRKSSGRSLLKLKIMRKNQLKKKKSFFHQVQSYACRNSLCSYIIIILATAASLHD